MKKIQFTDGIENICAIGKLVGCAIMVDKPNTEHAVLHTLGDKIIAHLGDYIVKDKGKIYVTKEYTKEYTKEMNWLEEKVAYALTYSAPKGFGVNPKVLRPISKRLIKTEGICPCAHDEWNESTPTEDKCCPCKTFRDTGECHCGLYVKL